MLGARTGVRRPSRTMAGWTLALGRLVEMLMWDRLDEELRKRERSLKPDASFEIECILIKVNTK